MRHPHAATSQTGWKTVRLLVFGHDDSFRFLARQTFRKLGVRAVDSFSVVGDTARILAAGPPDLVLVDLIPAAEEGLAVIERLRRPDSGLPAGLPVLAVFSPGAAPEIDRRARRLGIEGVVPKPVSGHELTVRVAAALAAPQRLPVPAESPLPPLRITPIVLAPPPAQPTAAPPPPAPVPAPAPTPSPVARRRAAPSAPVAGPGPGRRPAGTFSDEDLAPPPAAAQRETRYEFEDAPDPEAEARRRREAERRRRWAELVADSGHTPRTGGDVARLDLSAIVAEHTLWLDSKGTGGQRANFAGLDLAGADLAAAVLANASFREVDLSDCCLAGARLDGADFRRAILSAADLTGADLGVAALRHARLDLANLEGARLRGSDLSGAVLSRARLAGADLSGAVLMGADLRAADLSAVEGLRQPQLDRTVCDTDTRLPAGLFRPARPEA